MTTTITRKPLTARQAQVLAFIQAFHAEHRIGLGIRDISQHFGFASQNGALAHLWPLRHRGYVTWTDGRANSIVPVEVQDGE